jgi:hypothetical protein
MAAKLLEIHQRPFSDCIWHNIVDLNKNIQLVNLSH